MIRKGRVSILLLVLILLSLLPARSAAAQDAAPDSDYNDAAALMLAARNRMLGVEDANELRQLRDLRQAHFDQVQQGLQGSEIDTTSNAWQIALRQHNQVQQQLDTRANQLDADRNRRRNSNPLRRISNWVGRGMKKGGRALGAITSAAMTGVAKGAQYAVEEAPRHVINDVLETGGTMLLTGGTVNISMLKKLAVTGWRKRAAKAFKNHIIDEVATTLTRNGGGDELDKTLRSLADQDYDPGLAVPSTLDPEVAGNIDDEPDTSGIPIGPEGDMDYDDPDTGVVAPPMGSLDDSGAVVIGGVSSDPNPAGGSNISEKRPVAFKNTGSISATVKVQSYQPPEGYTGNFPTGSTVVSPGGNSSGYLELPLGRYVFCYDWDLGKDADGDGYTDYQHASSAQFSVIPNHSTNVNNAVVVTFSAPSGSPSRGRCGENLPEPAGGTAGLTPQELANQGTHTYTCSTGVGELRIEDTFIETNVFSANGFTVNGYLFTKIEPNVYTSDGAEVVFTDSGYIIHDNGGVGTCTLN